MASNPFDYAERFNPRNRRPSREADALDPVGRTLRRMQEDDLRTTLETLPDPEQAARTSRLARRAGENPLLVEGLENETERALQIRSFSDLVSSSSAMVRWSAQNPRGAAAAQDDTDNLSLMASAFSPEALQRRWSLRSQAQPDPTLWNSMRGVWSSLVGGWEQMRIGGAMAIGDWLGPASWETANQANVGREGQMRQFRQSQARIDLARPAFQSATASGVYSGVASAAQMAPGIAASVLTRSPAPAMMIAGLQTGSPAYAKYRSRGGTRGEATLGAGIEGGSEAFFELLPMGTLARNVGRTTGVGYLGRFLGEELITEQLTTLVQDAADTAIANPGKTWADYWAERPAAAYETAVATLVGSGLAGGSIAIVDRVSQRREHYARATAEGHFLDTLEEGAAGSLLRRRDPEAFRALLDNLTDGMVSDKVYIPADAVREYLQSEGFEDNEFWQAHENEIAEAELTGGDIVLPISEAVTALAGSSAWNALRGDMRLTPGGLSRLEAEAFGDQQGAVEGEFEALVGQRTNDARSRLFAVAYQKLVDAGMTAATASTQAELITARYANRSARLGTVVTGDEFSGVEVQQVLPERLREAAKADASDLVINALRRGKPSQEVSGPTLVEWIVQRGGINDTGGDLASMGLDRWHRQRPFRRKAIRDFDPQAAMGGVSGAGDYGLDTVLRAAVAEGYFPELQGLADNAYGKDSLDTQLLLDAIGEELAGSPRYAGEPQVDPMRAAAEELGQLLADAGRDPAAMSDAEIRAFVDRYSAAAPDGRSYASGERGKILFVEDGRAIIQLFKSRNLSTFLHESGHLFLEELKQDATSADAPEQLRADWQAVTDWFAANNVPVNGGTIPTEAHELWARGFERYLMEGKSPSTVLGKAFDTMRSWLVSIYRRVANLKSPISDDIRSVMDRLLATEDEIAERQQAQGLDPLFASMADAGMSRDEFAAYMDLVASARSAANAELLDKALSGLKARETAQYRERETEVRAEVARAVDARPEFMALDAVRSSPLNRQWIIDRFGADAVSLMPQGVPPSVKEGGAHPDSVAEAVGMASGRDLVGSLMGMEKRRKELRAGGEKRSLRQITIDNQTADVMAARYGDPFVTGEIEQEALAAVHGDMQGEVLAAEVRSLGKRVGKPPTPYSMAREWARRRVRSGEVRDHLSGSALQQYRRAAALNAHAAFEAVSRGDFAAAFTHKQAQLLNNALVREARDAGREVQVAVRRLERTASRKTIDGVQQDYLNQAHALLEQVDLRERSGKQIDRQQSYESWASAREDEGHTIAVPKSFAATIGKTNWTRLSASDLLGLDDAVKQVLHLGRLKQTLIDRQEQRDLDKLVAEATTAIERLPTKPVGSFEDPSRWDDIKSGVLGAAASLLKMETVFKRLDGGKHGAFNRVVLQPISEAQAAEHAMMREVLGELDDLLRTVPKKVLSSWNDQIEVPELADNRSGMPIRGPRSRLISMALNMGNESNAAKLAGGYGWRQDTIMQVLDRELTVEEWRYVQGVWDIIEKLWPKISELERRVNGVVPDKVRSRTLNTSAGILRGGYFPVVYDPLRSRTANEHAGKAESRLFENNYTRASTSRGFTKERTEVERPLLLSLDVINRHVAEVVHDLTHREVIMQADRFLSDRRVLDAVDETMGKDVSGLFRPWLQFIANEWSYDRAGVSKLESFMRAARRNTTFVGMAYRVSTIIAQAGGYVNAIERVGPKWFAVGINAAVRHPKTAGDFALERSHELRSRFDSMDRDIRENARRLAGKVDLASLARRYAFAGISYFDRLVSVPTWLGAYNKAIVSGMEEAQAIHEADAAVRESQGAGGAKDLAAIQRGRGPGGELGKALTMFYSYQSAFYNRLVDLSWEAGDAWRDRKPHMVPEVAARAIMLTVVAPALSAILAGQGPDEDDEEGWAEWAAKQTLYGLAAPIPLVRDVVPVAVKRATGEDSFGYRFTPLAGIGESAVRVAGDVRRISEGKETTRATRNALEMTGYVTGLVPGQGAASAQFFVDVVSGDAEPKTAGEWWEGATRGRIQQPE